MQVTGKEQMATYKSIPRSEISREKGNLGQYDSKRYDPTDPELLALKASILHAGGKDADGQPVPLVIAPIIVGATDNGFDAITGYRRLLCMDLLEAEGYSVSDRIDARVLTKDQASDPSFVSRVMRAADTTQKRVGEFATYKADFEALQEIAARDGIEIGKAKQVYLDELGFPRGEKDSPEAKSRRAREELLTITLRTFTEVDEELLQLAITGRMGASVPQMIHSRLATANKELEKLEKIEAELTVNDFILGFAGVENITREAALNWIESEVQEFRLLNAEEEILMDLPEPLVEAYKEDRMGLQVLSDLKEATVDDPNQVDLLDNILPIMESIASEKNEDDDFVPDLDSSLIKPAIKQYNEMRKGNDPTPHTLEECQAAIKSLQKFLKGLNLTEETDPLLVDKVSRQVEGLENNVKRIFDIATRNAEKEEKRLEREAKKAEKEAAAQAQAELELAAVSEEAA